MEYTKYLNMCPAREFQRIKRNEARAVRDQLRHLAWGIDRFNDTQARLVNIALDALDQIIESLKIKNTQRRKNHD